MSILILEDLKTVPLLQTILIQRPIQLYGIRIHVYKSLNPIGSILCECLFNDVVIRQSKIYMQDFIDNYISITNYWHGYAFFYFNPYISINSEGLYKFLISGDDGYQFSTQNHVAIVKENERRIAPMITEPEDWTFTPFGLEPYIQKEI